ncbi:hypothetical protein [uncultured Pseudomonas sp.]|uniref:hypothetical protein n=1 Tax=uncultured Pseudomonas sp. TaxID=114707 RepID=UPI002602E3BF|nr:hypothetical protein [uncultured Pseudomonas sp.]
MALSIALALALALLVTGHCLSQLAAKRHQQHLNALQGALLQRAIELLQTLQKHRGLGAQQDLLSTSQRNTLARQLDQLWLNWPGPSLGLAPLQQDWPQLRRNPADFAAHCLVIDGLLEVIETLETRLCQADSLHVPGIAKACHGLERLARLRGLSVRAANYRQCPQRLKQQILQLCLELEKPAIDPPLQQVLQRLTHELTNSDPVRLAPHECFALLTPLIDECTERLRLPLAEPSTGG